MLRFLIFLVGMLSHEPAGRDEDASPRAGAIRTAARSRPSRIREPG